MKRSPRKPRQIKSTRVQHSTGKPSQFPLPPAAWLQLTVSINRMYEDTTQRLESALAAVCNDFRPSHYTKVHLEGDWPL